MKRRKKKTIKKTIRKIAKIIGALGAASGATVGIFVGIPQIIEYWQKNWEKPSIYSDKISVEYLKSSESRDKVIYQLFDDEIDEEKDYKLYDYCATQIFITNHYDQEIALNSIKFVAENISVIETPILSLYAEEGEGYVDLSINNTGWGDCKDFKIEFTGKEEELSNHIKKDKLTFNVEGVKVGEDRTIRLWEKEDLVTKLNSEVLEINAHCEDVDGNEIPVIYSMGDYPCLLVDIIDGKFLSDGRGGPSDKIYGVRIDTSKSNFAYRDSIEEYIQPNETLALPICFFPDKSCNIKFYVEFTAVYDEREITIQSKPVSMEFEILNTPYNKTQDATQSDQVDLENIISDTVGENLVSYPFLDEKVIESRQNYVE